MPKFSPSQTRILRLIISGETTRRNLGANENTTRNLLAGIKLIIEGGESLGNGIFSPMTGLQGDIAGILVLYSRFLTAVIEESNREIQPVKVGLCRDCLKGLNETVQFVVNDQCFVHWLETTIETLTKG